MKIKHSDVSNDWKSALDSVTGRHLWESDIEAETRHVSWGLTGLPEKSSPTKRSDREAAEKRVGRSRTWVEWGGADPVGPGRSMQLVTCISFPWTKRFGDLSETAFVLIASLTKWVRNASQFTLSREFTTSIWVAFCNFWSSFKIRCS